MRPPSVVTNKRDRVPRKTIDIIDCWPLKPVLQVVEPIEYLVNSQEPREAPPEYGSPMPYFVEPEADGSHKFSVVDP